MKKQEYIKQKWQEAGFVWEEIESIVDEFGGLQLQHASLKKSVTGYQDAHDKGLLKGYDFSFDGLKVWNNLLDGVETNNGWTKIETRDDLPKSDGMYLFHFRDNSVIEQWHQDDVSIGGATHWRPIVKIPHPLY